MFASHPALREKACWTLLSLPLIYALGFEVGFLLERSYPVAMAMVAILATIGLVVLIGSVRKTGDAPLFWDQDQRYLTGTLVVLLASAVGLQVMSDRQSGLARIGDVALMLGLSMMMVRLRPNPRHMLQAAGAAMASTASICVVTGAVHGKLDVSANVIFGFGSVTLLGCFATPILLAWVVYQWKERQATTRMSVAWCVIGLSTLAVLVVMTERRGPILASLCPLVAWAALSLWRWSPRWTLVAFGSVAVLALILFLPMAISDPGTGRGQRFLLFRVAAILGWESFPFGLGPFGMLAADQSANWSAHLWIARERSALHAHNELLNAWVEGGVIHVGLWLAVMGLLTRRILGCSDPALKAAFLTLFSSWLGLAMVDNSFGTPLGMAWSGVIYGCIMCLPQTNPVGLKPVPRMAKVLAVAAITLGLGLGSVNWRMAFLSPDSPPHERLTALEQCRDPVLIQGELGLLVGNPKTDSPIKVLAVQMARNRIGWTANVPAAAVVASAALGDREGYVRALSRQLARNPFDLNACDSIRQACERWPVLNDLVPLDQKRRLALLSGELVEPEVLSADVMNFQKAADCFAMIAGVLRRGEMTREHSNRLLDLSGKYGQIEDVAATAIRACAVSADDYLNNLQRHVPLLRDGLGATVSVIRAFEEVAFSGHAQRFYPLLTLLFPDWVSRLNTLQAPKFTNPNDYNTRAQWIIVVRFWSMGSQRGH